MAVKERFFTILSIYSWCWTTANTTTRLTTLLQFGSKAHLNIAVEAEELDPERRDRNTTVVKFTECLGLSALVSKYLRTFIRNSRHQQLEKKLWISLLAVRRFHIDWSAWFLQIIGKDPRIATRTVWHWRWSRQQACSPTGSVSSLCCHWFVVVFLCKFFVCMNIFFLVRTRCLEPSSLL